MTVESDPDPGELTDLLAAYVSAFGEPVPLAGWHGPDRHLVALVTWAIRTRQRLDEADLARAQGLEPPPPGVLL